MPFPHPYGASLLALYYALRDGTIEGLGTGVLIGAWGDKALALTATHNGTYLSRKAVSRNSLFKGKDLFAALDFSPNFESFVIDLIGHRECDNDYDEVSIPGLRVPTDDVFDVALAPVLRLDKSKHDLRHSLPLKLLPPKPGERVFVTGFYGHERYEVDVEGHRPLDRVQRKTSEATVVARGDEVGCLTRGPSFEIDVEFPSGLSGAPVICYRDNYPHVCGIVSSSMEGSGRGTVAEIWPLLALPVPARLGSATDVDPFIELVRRGTIDVYRPDLDAIEVVRDEGGTFSIAWGACRAQLRR